MIGPSAENFPSRKYRASRFSALFASFVLYGFDFRRFTPTVTFFSTRMTKPQKPSEVKSIQHAASDERQNLMYRGFTIERSLSMDLSFVVCDRGRA